MTTTHGTASVYKQGCRCTPCCDAYALRQASLRAAKEPKPQLHSSERATYGATVTAVRVDDPARPTRTLAVTSTTAMLALREIAAEIDAWDGDWKVQSVSTPVTIMNDLRGGFYAFDPRTGREMEHRGYQAEANYLGKLRRRDLMLPMMLEPRKAESRQAWLTKHRRRS